MEERTLEELQEELWAAQKEQLLGSLQAKPLHSRLYRRLIDWEALRGAEDRAEALSAQLAVIHSDFPELFEERREAAQLPRFAAVGRSRRRSVSEAVRGIMGLK